MEAAEELGEPLKIRAQRRVEDAGEDPVEVGGEAAGRKAVGAHRVVVRPDRAVVIGHRVIAPLPRAYGPYAPAREHVL